MKLKTSEKIRFLLKFAVGKRKECWEWQGATDKDGYGLFHLGRRGQRRQVMMRASRVAYLLDKGAIPKGMVVRHTCDNPSCVNPNHLIVGTYQQNTDDIIARGRFKTGEQHGSTVLSNAQVSEILAITSHSFRPTDSVLARRYGVSRQLIQGIRTGVLRNGKASRQKASMERA